MELSIFDPEENKTYELLVNEEDFTRAKEDEEYVNVLLRHAKNQEKNQQGEAEIAPVVQEDNTASIHIWQYNEVVELIKSMSTHIEDFNHPRKRKQVFENIANDLLSLKFNVNATMVQNKWNSLVKSYRKAKDNKHRTGRGPTRFQFFDLIDEVLGTNPTNSCKHAINSSDTSSSSTPEPGTPQSQSPIPHAVASSSTSEVPCETQTIPTKCSEKKVKREYLQFKRQESVQKQKRHEDRVNLEREKIEIENRKLELLERYLQSKQ